MCSLFTKDQRFQNNSANLAKQYIVLVADAVVATRPQGSSRSRDPYVKYRSGIRRDGRILFRLVKILMRARDQDYLMTCVSLVHGRYKSK